MEEQTQGGNQQPAPQAAQAGAPTAGGGKQVVIYTTPTCQYCKATKDFFQQHGIQYQEFDVAADEAKRKEMIEKSGQMGVPVTLVDGEVVVGFDQEKLSQLLGIQG